MALGMHCPCETVCLSGGGISSQGVVPQWNGNKRQMPLENLYHRHLCGDDIVGLHSCHWYHPLLFDIFFAIVPMSSETT